MLELIRKVCFVQKHIGILELAIEPIFQLTHRMSHPVQIRVACQDHKGRPYPVLWTRSGLGEFEKGHQASQQSEEEDKLKTERVSSFDHQSTNEKGERMENDLGDSSFIMHLKNLSPPFALF